jgi:hypothetical protein
MPLLKIKYLPGANALNCEIQARAVKKATASSDEGAVSMITD